MEEEDESHQIVVEPFFGCQINSTVLLQIKLVDGGVAVALKRRKVFVHGWAMGLAFLFEKFFTLSSGAPPEQKSPLPL